jgi:hypothetical protein
MTENSDQLAPQIAAPINPWTVLSAAGIIIMETTWLALIVRAIGPDMAARSNTMVFMFLAGFLLLAALLETALFRGGIQETIHRGALVAYYLTGIYLAIQWLLTGASGTRIDPFTTSIEGIEELTRLIPGQVILAVTLLWLLWRGVTIARHGVGPFAVMRHFRLGVIMFLVYSPFALLGDQDLPGLGMFVLFIFATLMSLSTARVAVLGKFRGGRRSPFSRAWLGSIIGAVAVTVGVGFSLALLATGRFLLFYQRVLSAVVLGIITLFLSPFFFIIGLLGSTEFQSPSLPTPTPGPILPPWELEAGSGPNLVFTTQEQVAILPDWVQALVYWGATAIFLALIIFVIWRIRIAYQRQLAAEGVEFIMREGDLLDHLRREASKQARDVAGNLTGFGRLRQGQRYLAAAKIRRIYAGLMDLCEEMNISRPVSQTPLEFLGTVQGALPSVSGQSEMITYAYLKVRYGELPETQKEVQAVEQAWEQVRHAGEARKQIVQTQKRQEDKERKRREQMG